MADFCRPEFFVLLLFYVSFFQYQNRWGGKVNDGKSLLKQLKRKKISKGKERGGEEKSPRD
jgi:hypothetical protein